MNYCFKGSDIKPINVIRFKGPLHTKSKIKNVSTTIQK